MNAREQILNAIKAAQPEHHEIPEFTRVDHDWGLEKFKSTLEGIGGISIELDSLSDIDGYIKEHYMSTDRVLNLVTGNDDEWVKKDPSLLADVELMVIKGHFGVAENAAIWITEDLMGQRVAPFINQYLAVVIPITEIVPTMHQAYDRIANAEYGFGLFLAGPSKTADIEQSLVLGAHGARGLTVFLLK